MRLRAFVLHGYSRQDLPEQSGKLWRTLMCDLDDLFSTILVTSANAGEKNYAQADYVYFGIVDQHTWFHNERHRTE
jgi:hypothetical protein